MFGLSGLSRVKRFVLGIVVLLITDLIWVASSELTEYIFKDAHYSKPFFTTYVKTSMFILYLSGFVFMKPWRQQCRGQNLATLAEVAPEQGFEGDDSLSEPMYVPVKYYNSEDEKNSGTESEDASNPPNGKIVRFNNLSEVRQLSDRYAEEAALARLSYQASLRAEEAKLRALSKLSVRQVAKLALFFSILWFFANYAYQVALRDTEAGIVNVLSSTSGLFTLVCAAIYPSSTADRFSLSKLVAVLLSILGVVLVSISDQAMEKDIPAGALWALLGAILYAVYLVSLRRRVDHEDKLDIPMFFGFVGLFCSVIVWPGFLILHFSKAEPFEWPNGTQWLFIAINGLVGTVISEFLWLWGCFLTSSLIATLAISLTIPLTMMADVFVKNVMYSWLFYVGSVPVFVAFFAVSFLTHFENWDPVLVACKKCLHCVLRRRLLPRIRELDKEQTESLIEDSHKPD